MFSCCLLLSLQILLFLFGKISIKFQTFLIQLFSVNQCSSSLYSFSIVSFNLWPCLNLFSIPQFINKFNDTFFIQIFINIFVIYLYHWCIGTCSQTFHFLQCEHPILSSVSQFTIQMIFQSFYNFLRPSNHTRCSSTDLQMEFTHSGSIKHSVETGHFEYIHIGYL